MTSILIYTRPESKPIKKEIPLNQALADLDGWKARGQIPLDQSITEALELDDYVNQVYTNKEKQVSLYIGYYLTGEKIGAAHDPLVCFPGQGWVVKSRDKGELILDKELSGDSISYSTMIVEKGDERQLILYWFQSYDITNPDTFSQKLSSLYGKIIKSGEDNAFVRISISLKQEPVSSYKETILEFIKVFYPEFLNYIKS